MEHLGAICYRFLEAARKQYGARFDIKVRISGEGVVETYQIMKVVGDVTDEYKELTLENARRLVADCQIGDFLNNQIPNAHPSEGFIPYIVVARGLKISARAPEDVRGKSLSQQSGLSKAVPTYKAKLATRTGN